MASNVPRLANTSAPKKEKGATHRLHILIDQRTVSFNNRDEVPAPQAWGQTHGAQFPGFGLLSGESR